MSCRHEPSPLSNLGLLPPTRASRRLDIAVGRDVVVERPPDHRGDGCAPRLGERRDPRSLPSAQRHRQPFCLPLLNAGLASHRVHHSGDLLTIVMQYRSKVQTDVNKGWPLIGGSPSKWAGIVRIPRAGGRPTA